MRQFVTKLFALAVRAHPYQNYGGAWPRIDEASTGGAGGPTQLDTILFRAASVKNSHGVPLSDGLAGSRRWS